MAWPVTDEQRPETLEVLGKAPEESGEGAAVIGPQPVYEPGSQADFDRLYRDCYPRLVRTLYGVLGDAAAAEDCVQEAFVSAYRAWDKFRPDRPAEAWLYRIAFNQAISYKRKQKLREVGEVIRRLGRPGQTADPADTVHDRALLQAISSLPINVSSTFILRHYHGYTNREIAAMMNVSERAIGMRLAQARDLLRQKLRSDIDSELPTSTPLDVE